MYQEKDAHAEPSTPSQVGQRKFTAVHIDASDFKLHTVNLDPILLFRWA